MVVRDVRGICWLCGEVGHKAAECGGKGRRSGGVEAVEEEEVVADVGGGLDDCLGRKRKDKGERVASTNEKGGGSAKAEHGGGVCAQEQVWRAGGGLWRSGRVRRRCVGAGARAGASEHGDTDRLGGRRVGLPQKWAESYGLQAVDRPWRSD